MKKWRAKLSSVIWNVGAMMWKYEPILLNPKKTAFSRNFLLSHQKSREIVHATFFDRFFRGYCRVLFTHIGRGHLDPLAVIKLNFSHLPVGEHDLALLSVVRHLCRPAIDLHKELNTYTREHIQSTEVPLIQRWKCTNAYELWFHLGHPLLSQLFQLFICHGVRSFFFRFRIKVTVYLLSFYHLLNEFYVNYCNFESYKN